MKKVIMFGLLVAVLASAGWAVPTQINLQGRLVDKNTGSPITGTRSITFNLYTSSAGGTPVWTETQSSVVFNDNGIFNVLLGSKTALNVEFTSDYYYVGVTVAGDPEMLPLQRLVSVPYAYTAKNLEGGVVNARAASDTVTVIKGTNAVFVVGGTEYLGTGVRGIGKIGVSGFGSVAGGSFESTDGSGVRGVSATSVGTNAGVIGINSATNGWGVYGLSNTGYGVGGNGASVGVWGTSAGSATTANPVLGAGVYGSNTLATVPSGTPAPAGVYGTSLRGPGVTGVSLTNVGVYGKSLVAGGSFESTNAIGVAGYSQNYAGVFGKGAVAGGSFESTSGIGVYGNGLVSGGSFESVSGHGVSAISRSSTQAGVFAENSGYGPALKIGKGWISVSSEVLAPTTYYTSTINSLAGSVVLNGNYTTGRVVVNNTRVRTSPLIFLTVVEEAISTDRSGLFHASLEQVGWNFFTIKLKPNLNTGERVRVNFLIVNE